MPKDKSPQTAPQNGKSQSFLTPNGPLSVISSYGIYYTHRFLYTTSFKIATSSKDKPIYSAVFDSKSAPKGTDIVLHRGDAKTDPVLALGRFQAPAGADLFWTDKERPSTRFEADNWVLKQFKYRICIKEDSSLSSDDLIWQSTTNYGGKTRGYGNFELVDSAGQTLMVVMTCAHKSLSKWGTLSVLSSEMQGSMLDIVIAGLVALMKNIEKDVWRLSKENIAKEWNEGVERGKAKRAEKDKAGKAGTTAGAAGKVAADVAEGVEEIVNETAGADFSFG